MNQRQQVVRHVLLHTANQPFQYGALDCVQFVNQSISIITGVDHAKSFKYETEQEANQIINRFGGLADLFTHFLGAPCPLSQLDDGDPCLVTLPGVGELMGMRVNHAVMVKTTQGVITVQSKRIKKGWHLEWQTQ